MADRSPRIKIQIQNESYNRVQPAIACPAIFRVQRWRRRRRRKREEEGGTRCKRRRLMETRGDTLVTSSFCVIIAHVRVVFRMSTSNNARRPRWNEFSLGKEKEGRGRGRDWLKERRWPPFVPINYYTRVCFSAPPLLKKRKRSDSFLPFVDNNFLDTRYIAYIYCN